MLTGEVERKDLAERMIFFSRLSKKADLRPGEIRKSEGGFEVSGDAMACIDAMTPDGSPPMFPNRNKANIILPFSRLVYRAGD